MINILFIIQVIVLVWLASSVIYILVYAVSGYFYKCEDITLSNKNNFPKTVVFIPAFKEDAVICQVAESAINHSYLGEKEVVVIADKLQAATLNSLRKMKITLVEVSFEKSTKAKALNFAMQSIADQSFEMVMVLDADNLMKENALNYIAQEYMAGKIAIQGNRMAKNMNTNFAFLDAISEGINNHIYSKGPNAMNLSSRLVGSGMCFHYATFKEMMANIDAIGGFDKELELALIEKKIKIHFHSNAIIYDEKVSKPHDFANQRTRWISAQYQFLWKKLPKAFFLLSKGNFDYFYKTLQLMLPPRILMPFFLLVMSLFSWLIEMDSIANSAAVFLGLNVIAYSIAIPKMFWNKQMITAILSLPRALIITIQCLFKLNKAKKNFIHTPHGNE